MLGIQEFKPLAFQAATEEGTIDSFASRWLLVKVLPLEQQTDAFISLRRVCGMGVLGLTIH